MLKAALIALSMVPLMSYQAGAEVVVQENRDVQLLQAWSDVGQSFNLWGGFGGCERVSFKADPSAAYVLDCTQAVGLRGPAAAPVLLPFYDYPRGPYSPYTSGTIVEIRVVVSHATLGSPSFKGIGFYARTAAGGVEHVTPKDRLQIVSTQDVTLASNGERAAVIRFVLAMQTASGVSSTGWGYDSASFKPFAEFFVDGRTYRNYEAVPENYKVNRLPRSGGQTLTSSINRENEILIK